MKLETVASMESRFVVEVIVGTVMICVQDQQGWCVEYALM